MEKSAPSPSLWRSVQFGNVLLVSMAFFFVFFGFSSAQAIQTTAHRSDPSLGAKTLTVLYVGYIISCLCAYSVVTRIGIRASLVSCAFAYMLFVGSNLFGITALSYIGGALCGLAAGVMWTAHGVYITNLASEYEFQNNLVEGSTLGTFNGIFYSIFQGSRLASTLSVAVSFEERKSESFIFVMLTIASILGNCLMTCVRVPSVKADQTQTIVTATTKVEAVELTDDTTEIQTTSANEEKKPDVMFVQSKPSSSIRMLLDPRLSLILPIVAYQGISLGFIVGVLPTLTTDPSLRFFGLASFFLGDMICCFGMGRLSDKIGRLPILYTGLLAHLISFGMILQATRHGSSEVEPFSFVVLACLLGIGDGAWSTIPSAIIGSFFKDRSTSAFANYRLAQATGVTIAWAYYPFVDVQGKGYICVVTLLLGMGCLQILHSCIRSIEPQAFSFAENNQQK